MKNQLKLQIPEYRQKYVCFSACFVNAAWHFNKNLGSLKDLELKVTKEATAHPYLFILLPKLATIAIKNFGLEPTLYQSKENFPEFEEAKKEYDKFGMKFYKITNISENRLSYEEEEITRENYNFLLDKYLKSLKEALSLGLKVKIIKPSSDILISDLEEGKLSLWVKMLDNYPHSNLLYGYNNTAQSFYFFDPLRGGVMVKYANVEDYLKSPIMYMGLSLKSKKEMKTESV